MDTFKNVICIAVAMLIAVPLPSFAASHREAPITARDTKADITDLYAFVSYDDPTKVTLILNVDPLLAPGNGPNYFPFDDNILYAIHIDNNNDAQADVSFQFRFQTEIRAPEVFTGFVGAGNGIDAPSNSPPPVAPGTLIVPPAITSLEGAGSEGLSLRQTYTVTMVKDGVDIPLKNNAGGPLFAVPTNVGPRTMPNYAELAQQGIYNLCDGVKVFAGTVDDPFYIDLGAAFDSLNFRLGTARSIGGVLTPAQDADDNTNTAPDFVSGFNVNTIAIEVPIAMLTRTGKREPATNPAATIGVWGTTSRPQITVRRPSSSTEYSGGWAQVQRMGNPLINELIIGTGNKDFWSMSHPVNDSQFAHYALDPLLTRVVNAVYGINIPPPPRKDLLLLMQYLPPIAASGTPPGPVADLLRLNTGVPATPKASRRRLAVLAGDFGGFPNGRRVSDDVTDIALRVVAGGVLVSGFNVYPNNLLGDGVNTNDVPYRETFPYVAFAHDGRDSRHIDPGEPGCTMGGGAPCPIN
jgi:hypothetical protein